MKNFRVRLNFQPRDLWVGVYWRKDVYHRGYLAGGRRERCQFLDVWVCLLPCLPIHLSWDVVEVVCPSI